MPPRRPKLDFATAKPTDRLVTAAAAEYLGLTKITLLRHRKANTGPRYTKYGAFATSPCTYLIADLDAWREERTYRSTAEQVEAERRRQARQAAASKQAVQDRDA